MSIVTLQLGQAGNQLGSELFSTLAEELKSGQDGELSPAAGAFFYMAQVGGETRLTARSVLLDMEPKVIQNAMRAGKGRWHYSRLGQLTRQSGSGNNWAMGCRFHGPQVRDWAMNAIRRQVERCDSFGGFLLLQSVAGGTGSGLGAFLAEELREEYPQDVLLSHCIWPYECGEVAVQPYNSLLSLAHLSSNADGLLLVENEALNAICTKVLGIQRPSFGDMNSVAARNLASVLLPSLVRPAQATPAASGGGEGGSGGAGGRDAGGPRPAAARAGRPAWDSGSNTGTRADSGALSGSRRRSGGSGGIGVGAGTWDGSFGTGSRWEDEGGSGSSRQRSSRGAAGGGRPGGADGKPGQLRVMGDICEHLCAHPSYRLLTLRAVPQMAPGCVDFTTFNWPALLKRLKQMQVTGRTVDAGLDWSASASSRLSAGSRGGSSANRAISSLLVLRGHQAREADASPFQDPSLYPSWQPDPLLVSASTQKLAKLDMCATLLTNCQAPLAPVTSMLGKASRLYDARAYVHQYAQYGMECCDFDQAFEAAEDIVAKYLAL